MHNDKTDSGSVAGSVNLFSPGETCIPCPGLLLKTKKKNNELK
jgi:hypothetical protein